MTSFKLDLNNNLVTTANILTVSNNEAIAQDVKNRLLMFIGEYPFNNTIGLDYYDLASQNNKNIIENAIIKRTLEDTRIKSVSLINVNFNSKNMNINMELTLKNGEVVNV